MAEESEKRPKPRQPAAKKSTAARKTTTTKKAAPRRTTAAPKAATPALVNPNVASVSAVIPCSNNARTIATTIEQAEKALDGSGSSFEIIVVNDGSSDDSAAVLDALQADRANLRVITHARPRGYGAALRSGIAAATKDWVFTTDGDGRYDATELAKLSELAQADVDVVQGYAVEPVATGWRRVGSRIARHGGAIVFNLDVADVDCNFRLIRRSVLEQLALTSDSAAIGTELWCQLQAVGARWVQLGIARGDRITAPPAMTARSLEGVVRELFRTWSRFVLGARKREPGRPAAH